ncbi:two-component system response regulator [Desulfosarcina alkanivorans]|uniref:Two-component system response regulator n=1 Tax=Desulfosarcina alkanivorans TaxID=571177 RepID=A0A5K7YER7_9BACT|nr:HD domain-containing phosphohydrolase [Desulfosarcina alkanivorans]BBO66219.1 two-component system response regulator [Desulfosarcina alkanivorans]
MKPSRPLVLIVDDNPTNIDLLVNTLTAEYRLGIAKNGPNALAYAVKHKPDVVLLDIMMPRMSGYEVCARLKANPDTAPIPVIFITAMSETESKTKGFELGAVDYITKPFHAAEVKARIRTHVSLEAMRQQLETQNEQLAHQVEQKTAEIHEMLDASIRSMALMVEIRDPYTAGHQQRVAQLACAIAGRMGLEAETIEGLRIAGLLHDVGKIRIPVSILSRAGSLLPAEFEMIKIHPQVSFDILKGIPFPWPVARMVLQHHERLDGSGYPQGLCGDEILQEAKILAVADVTEANSSFRPYRPARGIKAALAKLAQHKGTQYDADVVAACRDLFAGNHFTFDYDNVAAAPPV